MTLKVTIDAGHGINTAGKRTPDGSMREYSFNSVVARYVKELLFDYKDVLVLFTHSDKYDVSLSRRTSNSNSFGADVLVSIHANGYGSGWNGANGIETFTYTYPTAESSLLARSVQGELIRLTGRRNRGVKKGNLHIVKQSDAKASILVECGFMTNKEEAALLKTDAYRLTCAEAIVNGIVAVYQLQKKEVVRIVSKLPESMEKVGLDYLKDKKYLSDVWKPGDVVTVGLLGILLQRIEK